jgi:uncharacterized membrane protein YhhN
MRRLLIASAGCALIFLLYSAAEPLLDARLAVIFEVAAILLLAVMAAMSKRPLLTLALCFSAFGDYLLDIDHLGNLGREQLFLCGLVSFLIAHLFYVALFVRNRGIVVALWRNIGSIAVVVVAASSLYILWPGLREMRVPVAVYSLVLTTMALTAQRSRFSGLVAVGALSFVASDTMLAFSLFRHPFYGSWALVWITYYAAQAMIAMGVVSSSNQGVHIPSAAKA